LRAVVFDFDGVLVDSEPLHFRSLRDCLLAEGITIDEQEYLSHYLAYDDRGALRLALERHGIGFDPERIERAMARKAAAFQALLPEVPFFPGARELIRGLAREVPLAIASGALHGEIEAILGAGGLLDPFAAIVGADDVSRGKPDPEPYRAAMRRLAPLAPGLAPEHCVAVEDSMPGVAAALAAGMRVVAVAHSYPPGKLQAAHRVVGSLRELDLEALRALA
jgi:beta-phosphoglucomutase